MSKDDYLYILREYLTDMTEEEKEETVKFYSKFFEDAGEENEQQVMMELGAPYELARVVSETNLSKNATIVERGTIVKTKSKKNKTVLSAIIAVVLLISLVSGGFFILSRVTKISESMGTVFYLGYEKYEFSGEVASFDNVDIDVKNCLVEFKSGNRYSVDIAMKIPEGTQMINEVSKNTLRIKRPEGNVIGGISDGYKQHVIITMPEGKYGTFKVNTTNEKITLDNGISLDTAKLVSTNGRIEVYSIKADKIEVNTSNGAVFFDEVICDDTRIETSNNEITILDCEGKTIEAKTNNGSIKASGLKYDKSITIKTSNASVELSLKMKKSSVSVDADTSNGSVIIDTKEYKSEARQGDGPVDVKVNSSNGDIEIYFE